ncbi:MAG TPA: extracellular solute-binding protein [Firmicutes bacterium]|jgi:ABC-type glycerol-3-phosphate transport system substrate-binding protein|nr:extracellular solute-binding protein [Bacillota bacterium]
MRLNYRNSLLVLVALVVLSFSVFAAPVQVWSPQTIEWNKIIQELTDADFTAKTNIPVDIHTIPWAGFEQKYLLAAASGDVPDVGITGSLGPADLGIRGAAVDLSRYGKEYEELRNQMFPGLMRSFEFMGTNFGLPMDMALYPMVYRSDILQELGLEVPNTWNELYEILPKLQANNKNFYTAFAFKEGQAEVVYADVSMFIWQHGGDWYTPDRTKSGLDTPESIKGFTEFAELFTKRGVPKAAESFMGFKQGELPLMLTSMWQYANFEMAAPELKGKWSISLVPGTKRTDGSINHAAYIGGMTFALFEKGKRVDDGFLWLKWFLSAETQGKLAQRIIKEIPGSIYIPTNINAIEYLPLPKEHIKVIMNQAKDSIAPAYALAPESVTLRFINFAAYEAVVEGANPETAIKKAARDMNTELDKKQREYARFITKLKK